jgi:hypothetical protein
LQVLCHLAAFYSEAPVLPQPSQFHRQPGTHLQRVGPVVVLGQGKIHRLIDQPPAAGRVGLEAELAAVDVLRQPPDPRPIRRRSGSCVKPKNSRSTKSRNCLLSAADFFDIILLATSFIFFGKTTGFIGHNRLRSRSEAA